VPHRPDKPQHLFLPPSFLRGAVGLLLAVGGPLLASRLAMTEALDRFPTTIFSLSIVAAALVGRLGAGAIAVAASILLLDFEFLPPTGSFRLDHVDDLLSLAVFGGIGFVFADLIARRDRAAAELEADRRRLQFIGEVGDALTRTMDYEERLREVARLAVPHLGDWCAIHLADNGRPRLVAVAHVDPEKVRFAEELQLRYPPDPDAPSGVAKVLHGGASELYRKIPRKLIQQAARDEEHLRMIKRLGLRSAIAVPIKGPDSVIGVLSLFSSESRRRFGAGDLALAEELGERAGLAIENARLYRERDHIAATLQRALLPPQLPEIPGFELQAFYRAALEGTQVGGDFYDIFPMPDGSWMAVIGDVCGKGPEAAALTGFVRHSIRALAVHETSPATILNGLNAALLGSVEGEQFSTVAIARIQPGRDGAGIVVSTGGHPRPVIVRSDGTVESLGSYGVIVGAFDGPRFTERRARLRRGETLLLYTDGLTSKDEGDSFQEDSRLCRRVGKLGGESAQTILEAIQDHVTARGEGDPEDDVAVLAIRPLPPARAAQKRATRGGSVAAAS
jgi:serine phosphatase RsbU (regulator of sigma subunit)